MGIILNSFVSFKLVSFDKASWCSFFSLGIWVSLDLSKYWSSFMDFAMNIPFIWFTTNFESIFVSKFQACISFAGRRPTKYFIYNHIIDCFNANLNVKFNLCPSQLIMIMPTPKPISPNDPSTDNFHVLYSNSSIGTRTFVNFSIKSTNVGTLIADNLL